MKHVLKLILFTIFVVGLPQASFAGGAPMPMTVTTTQTQCSGSVDETVGSIGIRLELGESIKPSVVGGVRYTETDCGNDVSGVLGEVSVPVSPNGFSLPTFGIQGIFGNENAQGVAGIGFNTETNQPLIGVGVQGKHIDGGVIIQFDGTITPYVGASSYEGPNVPSKETVTTTTTPPT